VVTRQRRQTTTGLAEHEGEIPVVLVCPGAGRAVFFVFFFKKKSSSNHTPPVPKYYELFWIFHQMHSKYKVIMSKSIIKFMQSQNNIHFKTEGGMIFFLYRPFQS
jgi:hypothetical protein